MKIEYKNYEFNIKDDKIDDWNDLLKNNQSDYGKHILYYVSCYCNCLEMCMEDGTGLVEAFKITDKASDNWNLSNYQYKQVMAVVKRIWYRGEDL